MNHELSDKFSGYSKIVEVPLIHISDNALKCMGRYSFYSYYLEKLVAYSGDLDVLDILASNYHQGSSILEQPQIPPKYRGLEIRFSSNRYEGLLSKGDIDPSKPDLWPC